MLLSVDNDLRRQAQERFAERVTLASMQLETHIADEVRLRTIGASLLAAQPPLAAALRSNDLNAASQIASTYLARTNAALAGASGIRVYDTSGTLLLRTETPVTPGQRAAPPDVLAVLRSGRAARATRVDEALGLLDRRHRARAAGRRDDYRRRGGHHLHRSDLRAPRGEPG